MHHPAPFLEVRVTVLSPPPEAIALCAGYELGQWRAEQFAKHLLKWLPEFALRFTELESLKHQNAVDLIGHAARAVYASDKYQKRGELGELLLHVALRQEFNTIPAISKYFFKDSPNDTVKGFDAVHVIAKKQTLELWLGEVKFYDKIGPAITDAIAELTKHLARDYLKTEFAAITNKIDDDWPHAARLKQLLNPNTSLDQVFDCACIPTLLTYNSETVMNYKQITEEFKNKLNEEIKAHHENFRKKLPALNCKVQLILIPLGSKADLLLHFDKVLKACQAIV